MFLLLLFLLLGSVHLSVQAFASLPPRGEALLLGLARRVVLAARRPGSLGSLPSCGGAVMLASSSWLVRHPSAAVQWHLWTCEQARVLGVSIMGLHHSSVRASQRVSL